jgi:hypothetical protein
VAKSDEEQLFIEAFRIDKCIVALDNLRKSSSDDVLKAQLNGIIGDFMSKQLDVLLLMRKLFPETAKGFEKQMWGSDQPLLERSSSVKLPITRRRKKRSGD